MCKKLVLLGTATLVLTAAGTIRADHVCRRYYLAAFEQQHRQLEHELRQRREALRYRVEEQRAGLHAEIRAAHKTLCGPERAAVVKSLHRKLAHVNRHNDRALRELHEHFEQRRRYLHRERDQGLRRCSTTRCTAECGQGADIGPPIGHDLMPQSKPPGRRPAYLAPPASEYGPADDLRQGHYRQQSGYREHPARNLPGGHHSWHGTDGARFDWKGLVLELLARRLNR